jgi:PAS domain S-box-containing protein
MKSIGSRFLIPFGLLAVFISIFVFHQAYEAGRKHAKELISQQAAVALEFNLAIRDYAADKIRPVMEDLGGMDMFMPETMSTSFISRSIFEGVRKKFPHFVIRFASENPRNPINTANPDELRMIQYFRQNPEVERRTEEIQIDGKRYLAHFTPKWMKKECLRCHDDPKDAPAELVKRYGATASFYRTVGDVAGLDTVAVPVEAISAPLAAEMRSQSMILATGLALLFGSILLVFRFVVTRRLVAMASHFNDIAAHAQSPWMIPVEVKGNDEISVVGVAFNKLVEQLRTTHASLELRVNQRTDELRNTNEQLQLELAERKRAQEALRESQQQLADIINFLPDATFVVDRGGKVIAWNRAMEEMTGIEAADMLGKGNYEYALPFYGERRPILIDSVTDPRQDIKAEYVWTERKGEVLTGEAYMPALGVGEVYLSATASALRDSKGNIVGAIQSIRDITERKRAEAALAESERRFSVFMDHLPAGIFIKDEAGRLLFANRFLREFFNWDQFVGKTTQELLPQEIAEQMLADDRKVLAEGPMVIHEKIADIHGAERLFDTHKFPIASDGAPILLGGIAVDMTDYKCATEALRQRTEELDQFFGIALDLLCIADTDGFFRRLNRAWEKTLGYSRDELMAKRFVDFIHPDDVDRTLATIATLASQKEVIDFVNRYRCKDGTYRWIEWRSAPAGNLVYAAARDITERKRAQEEKEQLEAQLRHAHKMEAVGTLAGGIAHDFNNILAAVIGYAEMALTDVPRFSPIQDYLQQVLKAGHRAKDLVKQILSFSRMHKCQERVPLEIAPIVNEALKLMRASLPTTIEIRQVIDTETAVVLADATEIHQVVVNLCTNAAQAMEETGGLLEVSLSEVVVVPEASGVPKDLNHGRYLRMTVSDTGHGMDPTILDRIFDPYFTTKPIGKGSGLGLAVVHGIVKRHQGAIDLRSMPGKGTIFTLYLPMVESKASVQGDLDTPIPRGNERILFVDDERALADLGQQMLEHLGYSVLTKTSSIEALQLFEAQPERFDLVITDYTMPQMTGATLAEEAMRVRPDIPVILCTGFTERITEEQSRDMRIAAFVLKPLNLRDMAQVVRRVLEKREH